MYLTWLDFEYVASSFVGFEIQRRTKGGFEPTKDAVSYSCVLTLNALILRSNSERWKQTRIETWIEKSDTTFQKESESKTFPLLDA